MIKNIPKPLLLSLQWHLTTNCSNHCKHCYMYDEKTYKNEKKNTLSLNNLIKILDDLKNFENKYNAKFYNIAFTGGDPLLREDVFEFFQEVKKRKFEFSLLGNPETLSEHIVKKLKNLNISYFQLSLDGLEKTHDFFRSKGSFKRTVEKTKLLNEYEIGCNIMFTLFPNNSNELIPLMDYVAKNTKATTFTFDIGCFVGEGKNLSKNFSKNKLYQLFSSFLTEKNKLEKKYPIEFLEKSNFHKIIRLEKGLLTENFTNSTPIISGCLIGWFPPVILSDGTNLVCRRLPIIAGKMPEESFENIYLKNITLKKFRRRLFFTGCKNCDLYQICRGCPATVYSLTKDPFAKNPLCFHKEINNKQKTNKQTYNEPSLDTFCEEEWNFIATFLKFRQNYYEYLQNKDFQYIYLELSNDENKKYQFLKNPNNYTKENNYNLLENHLSWLIYRFGERLTHKNYEIKTDIIAKMAAENIVNDIYKK